jgi:hypothetical protein
MAASRASCELEDDRGGSARSGDVVHEVSCPHARAASVQPRGAAVDRSATGSRRFRRQRDPAVGTAGGVERPEAHVGPVPDRNGRGVDMTLAHLDAIVRHSAGSPGGRVCEHQPGDEARGEGPGQEREADRQRLN